MTSTGVALTDEYVAALECLAAVFESYRHHTGVEAVLVGGATVAIYTSGMFPSGDLISLLETTTL
jgi:hypothetical protein